MNRKKSREAAMKILFQNSINDTSIEDIFEDIEMYFEDADLKELDREFVKKIVIGVNSNITKINDIIEENSENWRIGRISKINLAILRISIYEMLFDEEVPARVSINEAIELCKKYSDEKSVSFVNGILDRIFKAS
ncbi:NusB antitermination factor [Clostridium amylolyticum]|uniref:Transcription antitermination protein NusB n=1 Tax=Clostridium amylolyticum TaxID=1121298 RepID=A0A1M6KH74_9CLOT|nr:transcription antitermination factor NusB [Clostridium amylolyticum]SHJ58323.1 NusB antitermination factor [Clostridium amylolyticum]